MSSSHTWAVCEGLPSTIEGMLHVRALPCMWATCELYVRGSPPPLRECYTWGALPCMWATREYMSCTWGAPLHHWGNATCEGITVHVSHMWAVCEGLPSTIEGMLHMRALPCMWATRELYMRGSPPPLRECYMWGALPCTWATCDSCVCALLPSTLQKKWPKTRPSTTQVALRATKNAPLSVHTDQFLYGQCESTDSGFSRYRS